MSFFLCVDVLLAFASAYDKEDVVITHFVSGASLLIPMNSFEATVSIAHIAYGMLLGSALMRASLVSLCSLRTSRGRHAFAVSIAHVSSGMLVCKAS